MSFKICRNNCFINAPFRELEDNLLDLFTRNKLQPEIGLEGDILYTTDRAEFRRLAAELRINGLSCTLHAPFFDLAPGALDHNIRFATRDKLRLAFELIEIFKPKAIICHLNFEDNKHGYKIEEWFRHALQTWQELLGIGAAGHTTMMLENTYEKSPDQHLCMLQHLDSSHAMFCLDVGHLLAFAKSPWQDWLPLMDQYLGHIHLHDNNGNRDEHLALGRGKFDFNGLFKHLTDSRLSPLVTLEPHSEDDLWASIEQLAALEVVDLRV